MNSVFLSVGVPDARQHPAYYETADVIAIREAVRAVAQTVLPVARLVFINHPTFTPFVEQIAKAVGHPEHVVRFKAPATLFASDKFVAGVFIGGMTEVSVDFDTFRKLHPTALWLPVGSTGAAARVLLNKHGKQLDEKTRNALAFNMVYAPMFERLLGPHLKSIS